MSLSKESSKTVHQPARLSFDVRTRWSVASIQLRNRGTRRLIVRADFAPVVDIFGYPRAAANEQQPNERKESQGGNRLDHSNDSHCRNAGDANGKGIYF